MAEGTENSGRDATDESGAVDAFGRLLGPDWVELEPGIYEHRPARSTDPAPPRDAPHREPLEDDLLRTLPAAQEDTDAESTPPAREEAPRRRLFGR